MKSGWIAQTAGNLLLFAFVSVLAAETVPGRYIVELTAGPVSEQLAGKRARIGLQGAAASSQRARVRAEQQQVRLQLEQRQARILDSVDTVANALFVDMPDDAAAQVASMPGVKRVVPMRKFHLLLDRAVLLHKAADVWNRVGAEHAGEGVKIAIIDSGIDSSHPGFRDSSMAAPDSFPRAGRTSDLAYTNSKVIVARSYVDLLQNRDPDASARDHVGHGTALAMAAAGVRNAGPLATITGMAPRAYLGNYKVFGTPGFNDSTTDAAILKALDDAVNDGMDIVNLSLGDDLAPRLSDDLDVQAVERASNAGVLVVVAAGNNGPDPNTMSSPATAPSAIAVGATTNDRTFAASVEIAGVRFVAITGNGPVPAAPITAPVVDVAALDGDGRACSALPAGSLASSIALILRGTCTFESKLTNAWQAGAVAALVYAAADSPSPVAMAVGAATLPAEMVAHDDGASIKQALSAQSGLVATLSFTLGSVPVPANRLTDFSAAGPNVDAGIKPDLAAAGADIYVATQTLDQAGAMYDPSGYVLVDGTSFSSPLVAGAAALIKSARPGLTVDQYRSLLINTAAAAQTRTGQAPGVQQAGAGLLDADAALSATVTAYPVSLSFGSGTADARISRTLTLTNLGLDSEAFSVYAVPRGSGPLPAVAAGAVEVAPGASIDVPVLWEASGLTSGTYEGFLAVEGAVSGTRINVPYWYAVRSDEPAHITILDSLDSARRGSVQRDAVLFRVTDASGLPLPNVQPEVTVVSGGGVFRSVASHDTDVPGLFGIELQLGAAPGTNVFQIRAGAVSLEFSITGS
ncbi:MAG: S8 family serine peptidase [Bryobacteraceae bacterium]